jgi:D-alanyl-D-alanine carboxypeptidase/D-alanyl-D-alanine-endopeptidase (penicillin-binding protein 4)
MRTFFIISLALISISAFSQNLSSESVYSDSSLTNASVSLCVADAETGELTIDYNSGISLIPASVQKVITSSAALELLGPDYTFRTSVGFTGSLNKRSGKLKGNIIIRGGGDPSLGSAYFPEHYVGFMDKWIAEIKKLGIKRIKGSVITDDSYFDFQPVPARWLWEDAGNYYGAGAYGLSVFDNTYEIHFRTFSEGFPPSVTSVSPEDCNAELSNFLLSSGTKDEGYVFAAPYSNSGWIAGTIPADQQDFVLKASIPDPPLFAARVMNRKLRESGIKVSGAPSTTRLEKSIVGKVTPVTETVSPPLSEIIEVLNHESVNLIAEHLTKELGKKFKNTGSTEAGIEVINEFLKTIGINTNGIFLEDGSGLSPLNAINTREMVRLLVYMRKNSDYFNDFLSSLPKAGKDGTLANSFKDPVFESRLTAKSGSMTRVRSFAGYFTTKSGKNMVFSIIINNYSGPSRAIITGIEDNIKELIIKN